MKFKLSKLWKSTTTCEKIFLVSITFILLYLVSYSRKPNMESMSNKNNFDYKEGNDIYDDFYATVYDSLVLNNHKNAYEIALIENNLKPNKNSVFLDVGSGTGHHVAALHQLNYNSQGIDISSAMVNKAKKNFPQCNFSQANALKSITFPNDKFTHILCLYFTIYLFKNKRLFFQNCYNWLKPGGYLVLHLVNKDKFDPIIPVADVFNGLDPQKFSKKRITSSKAEFDNYKYQSDFKATGDKGVFVETFAKKDSGGVRKNVHKLFMMPQKQILSLAQAAGFIVISQNEMKDIQYYNQYIYILQKPN